MVDIGRPPEQHVVAGTSPKPSRPLDGIGAAADRTYRVGDRIESFLSRCQGAALPQDPRAEAPVCIGYQNELARLHGNLDRAEKLLDALESIG